MPRAWIATCAALASAPALALACLLAARAIDGLRLGPPWQLFVIYLLGPGTLTAGWVGAVIAAQMICPASRLGRAAVIAAEMALAVAALALAFPAMAWK